MDYKQKKFLILAGITVVGYVIGYAFYTSGIMIGAVLCGFAVFAALIYGFSKDPNAERQYKVKQNQKQIKRRK
ncbi:MAG: hypothetical protein IKR93_04085 [Firmicutes bacterium]|nr:hypothetical protein [Bacillota bacterium]